MSTIVAPQNARTSRFDALQNRATRTQIEQFGETFRFDRRRQPLIDNETILIDGIFEDLTTQIPYEDGRQTVEHAITLKVATEDLDRSGLREGDGGDLYARPANPNPRAEYLIIESITRNGHGLATLYLRRGRLE